MVGTVTKYFVVISVLLIGAAMIFGIGTGADSTGNVALLGTAVLGATGAIAAFLAFVSMEAVDGPSNDRRRESAYTLVPSYWPVMMSVGVGVLIVGLVINTQLAIFGLLVIIVSILEWTLTAWADRRSVDAAANHATRRALATPFEVPLYVAVGIAIPVFLVSRVFLVVSPTVASLSALGLAMVILAGSFILYAIPNARKAIVASLLTLGAAGLIVGGVVAAAVGERDVEPHSQEEGDEAEHGNTTEEGVAPDDMIVEIG